MQWEHTRVMRTEYAQTQSAHILASVDSATLGMEKGVLVSWVVS